MLNFLDGLEGDRSSLNFALGALLGRLGVRAEQCRWTVQFVSCDSISSRPAVRLPPLRLVSCFDLPPLVPRSLVDLTSMLSPTTLMALYSSVE